MMKACVSLAAIAATIATLFPAAVLAEDIDLYSPHPDADFRPKMVIGIDTSASMRFTGDAWAKPRLDRLKEPLIDFLRTTEEVDVGLSTFNGRDRGGAIVAPARRIGEDLCPDDACGQISLRTQIVREQGDGYEVHSSGTVKLTTRGLSLGRQQPSAGSQGIYLDQGGQSYRQTATVFGETEILPFSTTQAGEQASVGLHFPEVRLPTGAVLTRVRIYFHWAGQEWLDLDAGEGTGTAKTLIYLDARKNSPPFADAAGQRVDDRPLTTDPTVWEVGRPANWEGLNDSAQALFSPDFKDQMNQLFDPGDVGSMTVIIKPDPAATLTREDSVVYLGNNTRGDEYPAPRLDLSYELTDREPQIFTTGTRFDSLNVPPGATITNAWMEYRPRANRHNGTDALFQIRGEDSDDAADFVAIKNNFSLREKTGAQVNWSPGSWAGLSVRQRSADLSPIVQEIVDRPGWCAGNAMAMFLTGEGERASWAYRAGAEYAPSLHVSYDPASVDRSQHCSSVAGEKVLLLRSRADAVEFPDGTTSFNEPVLDTDTGAAGGIPYLGLRFENVQLDRGDTLSDARLLLTAAAKTGGLSHMEYRVDDDSDAGPFTVDEGVSARFDNDPSVRTDYLQVAAGTRLESGALTDILQAMIDAPDWQRGSDISMRVHGWAGVPVRWRTSLGQNGEGPLLRISTSVSGQAASILPFRTVRDELIEQVQLMPAVGNTPFVNLFEESARYLLGTEVVHGKRRGEQAAYNSVHRLSSEASYENGSVTRPIGCVSGDPGSTACAGETLTGTPTYLAPEASECRANQIVIVTDGAPTPSGASSAPGIRTLTGGACASDDPALECALELASWLEQGAVGRPSIRTSTIGFDFSSDFLDDLVAAGGGSSYSVANAGQVSEALRRISASVVEGVSSFSSPAAAVSQFGRASHRSDVYLTQFQPEAGTPLWSGNIKRYALGPISQDGTIGLVDVGGAPVLDDGQIDGNAQSWWSNGPDGAMIHKGGAASRLRADRKLLTYPAASSGAAHGARDLVPFTTEQSGILAADLGVSLEQRDAAIRWARGIDVLDENRNGDTGEPRRRLGAALHTTPSLVNYASSDPQGRSVVFAGTQEGLLHAIDSSDGSELFAFLPQELYHNIGPFFGAADGGLRHGLDGPITTWMSDENRNRVVDEGESAWLTVGMRRGGSHYYTFDISDPEQPRLLWSIDPTRSGFASLGQSWSRPVPATIPVGEGATLSTRRVLVFGSGYRPWNDADTRDPDAEHGDVGAIYFVDALSGELVTRLDRTTHPEMRWSIAADVVAADMDYDGVTDLFVAADLGGNVWRVDASVTSQGDATPSSASLQLALVARLADRPMQQTNPTGPTEPGGDRRFFHAPDIGLLRQADGTLRLGLAIGSGRRDMPLESATLNRLYVLYLDPAGPGAPGGAASPVSENQLFDATSNLASASASPKGWYVDLPESGEKMLGTPLILQNRVIATSYVPPQVQSMDPCAPDIGGGKLYTMDIFSGAGLATGGEEPQRSSPMNARGIPPPVAVYISAQSPDQPVLLVGTRAVQGAVSTPAKLRTYWAEE